MQPAQVRSPGNDRGRGHGSQAAHTAEKECVEQKQINGHATNMALAAKDVNPLIRGRCWPRSGV